MKPRILGRKISSWLMAYYRGPDHLMKLRLWRWFRSLTGYPRLTIPYADGGWITVDERCLVQECLLRLGFSEKEVWTTLASFADSNEIFWDVGAHVGVFTLQAMQDRRIREVHAFEPDPFNRNCLLQNLALNPGSCVVHECALGSQSQRMRLYRGLASNTGLSSLVYPVGKQVVEIECETADELIYQKGVSSPTLMKIDVEGWELHVLKGAQRLLTENPPKAIVFEAECSGSGKIADASLEQFIRTFSYEIQWVQRPSGGVNLRENFLAFRKGVHR